MSTEENPKVFFWAQFFGHFDLLVPIMTLFGLHRGLTLSDILFLLVIDVTFSLLFEIPTGAYADKYGQKSSLIVSQILHILVLILLIFAFNKWIFYLIAAIAGISCTFRSGVEDAIIYESLKENNKQHTMTKVWGKIKSAPQFALAIAAIFGAYFAKDLKETQFVMVILFAILFSLVKLILLTKLTTPRSHRISREIHPFDHLKEAIRFTKNTPALFWMTIGQMFIYIPFWSFKEIAQPFLKNANLPVFFIGILYALTFLSNFFILNKISWIESKINKKSLIYLIAILNLLAYLAAAFIGNFLIVAIIVFFSLFLLRSIRTPIFSHIFNNYITSSSRSTILSLYSALDSLFDIFILATLSQFAKISLVAVFLASVAFVLIGLIFPVKIKS